MDEFLCQQLTAAFGAHGASALHTARAPRATAAKNTYTTYSLPRTPHAIGINFVVSAPTKVAPISRLRSGKYTE